MRTAFGPFWQGLLAWASTLDDHTVRGPSPCGHLLEWLSAHSHAYRIVSLGHRCQAIMGLNERPTELKQNFPHPFTANLPP